MELIKASGNFTQSLWDSIHSIFNDLIEHPFVKGLSDGSLPKTCFNHYLQQDILYIKDDSEALQIVSKRSELEEQKIFFKALAEDGIEIEKSLHNEYLSHFDIQAIQEKSASIKAYTEFLLNHAKYSKLEVVQAALLPCFWVYATVGKSILQNSYSDNPYQKWITTYEGGEYEIYIRKFIQIVEEAAKGTSEKTQIEMKEAFLEATKLELAFFEEAWSKQ